MKKIILASSSPRRKAILKNLRIPFVSEESGYKEDLGLKMRPRDLAKHLALRKAEAVARRHPDALVIGADTIVVLKDEVLGKPKNAQDARKMLARLSGNTHAVITGFAIIDGKTGKKVSRTVITKVSFRKLSEREIAEYVAKGESLDVAGAYALQSLGSTLIRKIDGDYSNVVGLPLAALVRALKKFGRR